MLYVLRLFPCLYQESGDDAYRLKLKSHHGPINVLLVQDDDSSPPPAKQPHLDTATQSQTTTSSSQTGSSEKLGEDTSSLQTVSEEPIPDQSRDEDKMETSEQEIATTEGGNTVKTM